MTPPQIDMVTISYKQYAELVAGGPYRWRHYVSTYCIHEKHKDCRLTCKVCEAPCLCPCHAPGIALDSKLDSKLESKQTPSDIDGTSDDD